MKKLFVSAFAIFACLLSFNLSAQECTGISIDWDALSMYYEGSIYYSGDDPMLRFEFYQEDNENEFDVQEGTYDLGTGGNTNYKTCTECVRIFKNYDEEAGKYGKQYFQKSGTLTIDAMDRYGNIKGTISAQLVEVTMDSSYNSTPVTNGECLEIESAAFDSGVCVPQCDGKICGSDGCGGTCGDGCGELACSADQKSCVPWECDTLAPGEVTLVAQEGYYGTSYYYQAAASTGDTTLDDFLRLQFYNEGLEVGTIDLAEGDNANYATCTECFLYLEDLDEDGYPTKIYFQQSGELVFDTLGTRDYESTGHANFRLVEVEMDSNYNSIPVAGGKCYNVENLTWDTICVPQCDGKICGDDGCGGTCGEGCGDKMCSADQKSCVDYECTKITLNSDPKFDGSYIDYGSYSYEFNHTPVAFEGDYTTFELYEAIEAGEYNLADTNYSDCAVCMQLFEEISYDEEGNMTGIGRRFFQKSGKVNVTSFDDATGNIKATLNNVRLVEVTVDSNWNSSEVAGGKCYDIETVQFAYPKDDTGNTDPTTEPTTDPTTDPTDTGDTDNTDTDDNGDTEVPGNTDDTDSKTDEPTEDDQTPAKKKSSGCTLVTL